MDMRCRDRRQTLCNRSLKGTAGGIRRCRDGRVQNYPAKLALTPEKVTAIRYYYNQRIRKYVQDQSQFNKRINTEYFNKLVATAIFNISKKMQRYCTTINVGNLLD